LKQDHPTPARASVPRPATRADLTQAGLGWAESAAVPERHGALCFPTERLVFIRPGLPLAVEADALAGVLRRYAARAALEAAANVSPQEA